MNADGKSDEFVVPTTRANNAEADSVAESVEERNSAKKNVGESDLVRAPKRNKRRSFGLAGVRETARAKPELKFTSLLHHVNEKLLAEAFFDLKKTAAVGVDEVTWHDYEQDLEDHIKDLHGRIHRGAYRFTGERTGQSPPRESTSPSPTVDNDRSGLHRWRTRSSRRQSLGYCSASMSRTFSDSVTGSGPAEASTRRLMH